MAGPTASASVLSSCEVTFHPHSYADTRRTRDVLGFAPVVDFAPGLKETLDWYAAALATAPASA